jgi:tRNA pseudouridine55 synthase
MEKEYDAVVRLGVETDSHDSEGEVVAETQGWDALSPKMVEEALEDFRGPILQKPPAYSAKKVRGEAAHRRVRRGESVDLEPVEVVIEELALLGQELPEIRLKVRCSSGTYIRSLARDLGRSLEVGAHLTGLRRTSIGPFSVDSAVAPDVLDGPEAVTDNLIPPSDALSHFPAVEVDREAAGRLRQGRYLPLPHLEIPEEVPVRILLEGALVALAAREGRELRPRKVFSNG